MLLAVALGAALALYFLGKTTKPAEPVTSETLAMGFGDYEALHMGLLPEDDASRLRQLSGGITLDPSVENYLELSKSWEDAGNYPLGAFYYHEAVRLHPDSLSWESAGDKLFNSYLNYGDSLITNNLLTFALASYEKAYNADKGNVELRMKLAETYIESPEPMKGILHLREIADSLPGYVPALMRLGRLSLQTGQYDKAEERFLDVLDVNPVNTEALYFLALANEGLGRIDEAIRLLEMCRDLVDNPAFTQEINNYIGQLRN